MMHALSSLEPIDHIMPVALSADGAHLLNLILNSHSLSQLDNLSQLLWQAWAAQRFDDSQAQYLSLSLEQRRKIIRPKDRLAIRAPHVAQQARAEGRPSHFPPKRSEPPIQDRRASIKRRRTLAATGGIPHQIASHFTMSEQAVLTIVVIQVRLVKECRLSLAEIAAKAGCRITTARNAIRKAAHLGFLTIQERRQHNKRNLPNIVRIISKLWLEWVYKTRPFPRDFAPPLIKQSRGSKKIRATNTGSYRSYYREGEKRPQHTNEIHPETPKKRSGWI